jgi:hypothetical protein
VQERLDDPIEFKELFPDDADRIVDVARSRFANPYRNREVRLSDEWGNPWNKKVRENDSIERMNSVRRMSRRCFDSLLRYGSKYSPWLFRRFNRCIRDFEEVITSREMPFVSLGIKDLSFSG